MHPLRPGDPEQVGEYSILGRVGEGPRGVVYLGQETDEGPVRAIKVFTAAGEEIVDQLRSAKRVSSSYVARTLDAGMVDGKPYLVREHVEGRSLAETVEADGPLEGDALERAAVGMLTALTAIHLTGLSHRGLTPHNVILGADGPRVTDAGAGEPEGEVGYRAPEQLNGLQHGPYADIFSWAATVVFAASGQPPFGHEREAVLNEKPDVGDLEQPLRRVVVAALAKDVGQRPTTYTALLQLLGDKSADKLVAAGDPAAGQTAILVPPQVAHGELAVPPQGHVGPPIEGVPVQAPHGQLPPRLPDWVATQPAWGPPGAPQQGQLPPPQEPQQVWHAQANPQSPPRRKSFPLGLVAGVGVVALMSGLGLWGASQYTTVGDNLRPAAAEGKVSESPATGGEQAAGNPGDAPAQPQPTTTVTMPWATTSANPDEAGVGPLVLPSEWTTDSPQVPELTSAPLPTQSIAVPTTQPQVAQPPATVTVTPTAKPSEKASDKESDKPTEKPTEEPTEKPKEKQKPTEEPTPTPEPTPTKEPTPTEKPSEKPTEKPTEEPSEEPKPTPTKSSPKPTPTKTTPKPSPTPTPTKTTPKPAPTPTKTTAPPPPAPEQKNPHTATGVCGSGYYVQRQSSFSGGTTYQLYNSGSGQNCVVTMKTTNVGKETPVSATLEVQGGGSKTDSGNFKYYAGPVYLPAAGKCVKYSGSAGSGSTSAGWANCG
ncbi:serine/threonine protein kinase [Nonomuraea dietziae]|uniref:serine/threonine protein kinase n=1 Tax=Nonomuraea dietziae TaxID=65515 RepID=UPI0033E63065